MSKKSTKIWPHQINVYIAPVLAIVCSEPNMVPFKLCHVLRRILIHILCYKGTKLNVLYFKHIQNTHSISLSISMQITSPKCTEDTQNNIILCWEIIIVFIHVQ